MSAFDQTGQTVGHQVNQYADERREIAERAMRTWQHKYDMEHQSHERTKDALAASEAARSVLREALGRLLENIESDGTHKPDSMTPWCQTCKAIEDARAALAATEERGTNG